MRIAGRALTLIGLLGLGLAATPALAQQPVPPTHYSTDERGVDLTNGGYFPFVTEVVIGQPGAGGLVYGRSHIGTGWRDSLLGTINGTGMIDDPVMVSIGGYSDQFVANGSPTTGPFTPFVENGATLAYVSGEYIYTTSTGVVAVFDTSWATSTTPYLASLGLLESITAPNGEVLTYSYRSENICANTGCTSTLPYARLQSITNTYGYQLKYEYHSNGTAYADRNRWRAVSRVTGLNRGVDYCADLADSCTYSMTWPSVSYSDPEDSTPLVQTVTDEMSRVTTYESDMAGRLTGITLPGSSGENVTVVYNSTSGVVESLSDASGTWNYAFDSSSGPLITSVGGPDGQSFTTYSYDALNWGMLLGAYVDADNEMTEFTWHGPGQIGSIIYPEDNAVEYTYDARGNVIEVRQVAKPGSGLSDIVTSWTYPSTCSDPETCNQPTSMTDPRGLTTDYAYDENNEGHGLLTSVTYPARYTGWDRPQVRIDYAAREAWYLNSSEVLVASGAPIWLPVETSSCAYTAICDGDPSERVTTVTYGASSVINNLLPTVVTTGAGDNSLSITSTATWTAAGDAASIDGPLAGADDRTVFFYDAGRDLSGMIGPDPDLTGSLAHRAMRIRRYAASGLPQYIDQGTTAGYTTTDFANFTPLQTVETIYDPAHLRPVRQSFSDGTTTFWLAQVDYDASGRVDCTAMRMNPATYGAPPSSACTAATAGIYGPDRISRMTYDDFGRVASTISGYGSGDAITEALTYTENGQVHTLTDGEGNLTTWVYDGFDRVSRMRYPVTSGSGSSTTDYEEWTYNAASLPTSHRLRDGSVLAFAYDNLNQLNFTDAPSGQQDVGQWFDNLGRMYTAISYAVDAQTLQWGTDILGRAVYEIGPLGTVNYQYDAASRLTRITWPDTYYAGYEYDLTGAMTAVRENGATSGVGMLAAYAYDDLGQRTLFARGNGVNTTYGWNGGSQLTALVHDLAGTGQDQTFTYSSNPTGQLSARNGVNDLYAYDDDPALADSYTIDGLNRVTAVDSQVIGYDSRQNITGDGTSYWTYDVYNRLIDLNTTTDFAFDPVGRLYSQATSSATRRLLYAGGQAIGAYDGSNALIDRYVPGAALDDYAAYTQGTTTITRQWPITDQLGSVIGLTNASGAATQINAYDEYGVPGPGNAGPFGYAGSMAMGGGTAPWHMRNRQYHPGLGRFLQTDPIGLTGGVNLYAYVGNDPVNLIDPFGLQEGCPPDDDECSEVDPVVVIGTPRPTAHLTVASISPLTGGSPQFFPLSQFQPRPIRIRSARSRLPTIELGRGDDGPDDRDDCSGVSDVAPTGEDFSSACRNHDRCYTTLGQSRHQCEARFQEELLASCRTESCRAVARDMYSFTVLFGIFPYAFEQGRSLWRRF